MAIQSSGHCCPSGGVLQTNTWIFATEKTLAHPKGTLHLQCLARACLHLWDLWWHEQVESAVAIKLHSQSAWHKDLGTLWHAQGEQQKVGALVECMRAFCPSERKGGRKNVTAPCFERSQWPGSVPVCSGENCVATCYRIFSPESAIS